MLQHSPALSELVQFAKDINSGIYHINEMSLRSIDDTFISIDANNAWSLSRPSPSSVPFLSLPRQPASRSHSSSKNLMRFDFFIAISTLEQGGGPDWLRLPGNPIAEAKTALRRVPGAGSSEPRTPSVTYSTACPGASGGTPGRAYYRQQRDVQGLGMMARPWAGHGVDCSTL